MRHKLIKILSVALCCVGLAALASANTSAISDAKLDMYAANNIMFYDPGSGGGNCKGGTTQAATTSLQEVTGLYAGVKLSGTTIEEKIWNGLKKQGVTDVVAAGIMGNMYYESAMNPARHEKSKMNKYWPMALNEHTDISYGIGLIQWSFGRRKRLYNYIAEQAPGLENTFMNHPEAYSKAPVISGSSFLAAARANGLASEADRLILVELDYLINVEMKNSKWYKKVFDETSVKGAAQRFSINVEGCANCRDVNNQSVKNRVAKAQEFYEKFQGTGDTGDDGDDGDVQCTPDEEDDGSGGNPDGGGNPYGEGGYQGDDYTYTGDVASLQHLVSEWAWGTHCKKANRTCSEQTAAYRAHTPKYGGCNGNDCGGFVAAAIITSGWDSSFKYQAVKNMIATLYKSSTWKEMTSQIHGDGDMQPGDIIICSHGSPYASPKCQSGDTGHVMLWVGSISGFNSKIASASLNSGGCGNTRAPSASESTGNIMHHIKDVGYSVYRKVK